MLRRTLPLAVSISLVASTALPCAFHGYVPQATFVERLLGSDHIVLARPTAQNPFRFTDVKVLEGGDAHVDIPHLADSVTRLRLATNQDDYVLFAREGAYGPWKRIAYVDAEMDQVLRTVMTHLPDWQTGSDPARFAYFASLLDNADLAVQSLALRELDLAEYGQLRSVPIQIDPQKLLARLDNRSELDLKPIRVLLLGLNPGSIPDGFFEAGVTQYAKFSGGLLGAYATAMIENGGPEAAERLVENHLMDASLPPLSRELITEALAIHSSVGDAATRMAIREVVGQAVTDDPSLAPIVARHFGARYDWSQGQAISELMQAGAVQSPLDILLLTQYVSLARENAAQAQN